MADTAVSSEQRKTAAPARTKGSLVWLDMDQQELDDAYDQAVYAPNRDRPSSPAIQQRACPHRPRRAAALLLWAEPIRVR